MKPFKTIPTIFPYLPTGRYVFKFFLRRPLNQKNGRLLIFKNLFVFSELNCMESDTPIRLYINSETIKTSDYELLYFKPQPLSR